jgi:hypothetical protein
VGGKIKAFGAGSEVPTTSNPHSSSLSCFYELDVQESVVNGVEKVERELVRQVCDRRRRSILL